MRQQGCRHDDAEETRNGSHKAGNNGQLLMPKQQDDG
jgi:hypothetical protein